MHSWGISLGYPVYPGGNAVLNCQDFGWQISLLNQKPPDLLHRSIASNALQLSLPRRPSMSWNQRSKVPNGRFWIHRFTTMGHDTTSFLVILLMEEILHRLIGSLSHYLQGFVNPRWLFRISSINSTTWKYPPHKIRRIHILVVQLIQDSATKPDFMRLPMSRQRSSNFPQIDRMWDCQKIRPFMFIWFSVRISRPHKELQDYSRRPIKLLPSRKVSQSVSTTWLTTPHLGWCQASQLFCLTSPVGDVESWSLP